jgi:H+-translocating diphosphatase
MAELPPEVREKTDALDAAGNTTAAVGKGFAIGSAALVSLALYGAFVVRIRFASKNAISQVEILHPLTFAFLLIGANLPFWFSAMTMKSVGEAAMEMVLEVERQFNERPELLNPTTTIRPDYDRCVAISTRSALREMIAPGALVLLSPLIAGTFFGVNAVFGLLTGSLLSGVQLGKLTAIISMQIPSNSPRLLHFLYFPEWAPSVLNIITLYTISLLSLSYLHE